MNRTTLILVGAVLFCGAGSIDGTETAPISGEESKDESSLATLVAEGRLGELEERLKSGLAPEAALTAAVRHDSPVALGLALGLGADPRGLAASKAFLRAKRQGLDWAVEELARAGADLEGRDAYGRTLLILEVQEGTVGRVRDIVSAGANVDATSNIGSTGLMEAVASGRLRMVKVLLDSDADLEAEDRDGWTALSWAVRGEDREIVRLVLARGANPNHIDRLGWTPLLLASAQADPIVVHELLARGAYPNLSTPAVGAALIRAVQGGDPEVVRQLLAYGADPRPSFAGRNARAWAESLGRAEIADLLASWGDQR